MLGQRSSISVAVSSQIERFTNILVLQDYKRLSEIVSKMIAKENSRSRHGLASLDLDTIIESNRAIRNLPKAPRLRAATMMKETLTGRKAMARDPSPHVTQAYRYNINKPSRNTNTVLEVHTKQPVAPVEHTSRLSLGDTELKLPQLGRMTS